ncbi:MULTISPECIES: helix-turn-helix domain-containing protein [Haloferax]|uniref:Helix-turn-helix domain-containing protein n=1 Tax=Haloferax marinum TaxID=2666143 RepID=A0A6A8G4E3_9EURY|nr:helix-turn-helix domain-containing protein [Haloferax marinum]KAB1198894.1 helix-turn-helix transcriptional regulator [Haloferax sp. CBA1150]MRW95665.1 helix-turn-helix domain-containing protein [Haloferax marinum]
MQTGLTRKPTGQNTAERPSLSESYAEMVLDALSNQTCRRILTTLQGSSAPMTAQELSEECDVPLSTTYRKLEHLSNARLVDETLQLRKNGTHTSQYRTDVDSVTVSLGEDSGLTVAIPGGR